MFRSNELVVVEALKSMHNTFLVCFNRVGAVTARPLSSSLHWCASRAPTCCHVGRCHVRPPLLPPALCATPLLCCYRCGRSTSLPLIMSRCGLPHRCLLRRCRTLPACTWGAPVALVSSPCLNGVAAARASRPATTANRAWPVHAHGRPTRRCRSLGMR